MIVTLISRWLVIVAIGAMGMLLAAGGIVTAQAEDASGSQEEQSQAAADDEEGSKEGDYTVVDGKVDQGTYDGYLTYTRVCQACHGPDGMGSSFAPSLMERVQNRTFAEFAGTVAGGLEVQPGQVMPSFSDDPNVMNNVENIYSYLKARAAGDVGRGRPKVIEDESEGDGE